MKHVGGPGRQFGVLWSASAVSTLGDGIVAAAAPLLVTSLTRDPVLVGLAVFVRQAPWLLLAPVSGVLVDRVDRRRLTVAMNAARAVLTAVLAGAVFTGAASLPLICAVGLLLGSCAALGVAAGLPMAVDAATFAGAAALLSMLRLLPRDEPAAPVQPLDRRPRARRGRPRARVGRELTALPAAARRPGCGISLAGSGGERGEVGAGDPAAGAGLGHGAGRVLPRLLPSGGGAGRRGRLGAQPAGRAGGGGVRG
ncbi:MFS transporter [Kitasatospora griseola]|uniref:MFS transporter n=1 Tax=Kitasatospora griseola TaxID=2064 RepID=UPI0037F8CE1B